MIGSTRYSSDDVAIAPPVTPPAFADRLASITAVVRASCPSRTSSGPPMNAAAVMSVNATMM